MDGFFYLVILAVAFAAFYVINELIKTHKTGDTKSDLQKVKLHQDKNGLITNEVEFYKDPYNIAIAAVVIVVFFALMHLGGLF